MGNPRVVSHFKYGERSDVLIVEGDSDHAGCVRTRKSTSGGVIRWGTHVLKWWSKTQPTLALSSGEAELAAIVRSTSEGLGMQAMMEEFGLKVDLVVKKRCRSCDRHRKTPRLRPGSPPRSGGPLGAAEREGRRRVIY